MRSTFCSPNLIGTLIVLLLAVSSKGGPITMEETPEAFLARVMQQRAQEREWAKQNAQRRLRLLRMAEETNTLVATGLTEPSLLARSGGKSGRSNSASAATGTAADNMAPPDSVSSISAIGARGAAPSASSAASSGFLSASPFPATSSNVSSQAVSGGGAGGAMGHRSVRETGGRGRLLPSSDTASVATTATSTGGRSTTSITALVAQRRHERRSRSTGGTAMVDAFAAAENQRVNVAIQPVAIATQRTASGLPVSIANGPQATVVISRGRSDAPPAPVPDRQEAQHLQVQETRGDPPRGPRASVGGASLTASTHEFLRLEAMAYQADQASMWHANNNNDDSKPFTNDHSTSNKVVSDAVGASDGGAAPRTQATRREPAAAAAAAGAPLPLIEPQGQCGLPPIRSAAVTKRPPRVPVGAPCTVVAPRAPAKPTQDGGAVLSARPSHRTPVPVADAKCTTTEHPAVPSRRAASADAAGGSFSGSRGASGLKSSIPSGGIVADGVEVYDPAAYLREQQRRPKGVQFQFSGDAGDVYIAPTGIQFHVVPTPMSSVDSTMLDSSVMRHAASSMAPSNQRGRSQFLPGRGKGRDDAVVEHDANDGTDEDDDDDGFDLRGTRAAALMKHGGRAAPVAADPWADYPSAPWQPGEAIQAAPKVAKAPPAASKPKAVPTGPGVGPTKLPSAPVVSSAPSPSPPPTSVSASGTFHTGFTMQEKTLLQAIRNIDQRLQCQAQHQHVGETGDNGQSAAEVVSVAHPVKSRVGRPPRVPPAAPGTDGVGVGDGPSAIGNDHDEEGNRGEFFSIHVAPRRAFSSDPGGLRRRIPGVNRRIPHIG